MSVSTTAAHSMMAASSASELADQIKTSAGLNSSGLSGSRSSRAGDAKRLGQAFQELAILEKVPSRARSAKQKARIAKLRDLICKLFNKLLGGEKWSDAFGRMTTKMMAELGKLLGAGSR